MRKIRPGRLKDLLERHFDFVKDRSSNEEICIICPECEDQTGNRYVNLSSNLTNCWKCDEFKGPVQFLLRHHGVELEQEDLEEILGVNPIEEFESEVESDSKSEISQPIEFPKGFISLRKEPSGAYADLIGDMAQRKKLSLEDFINADVGFTREGIWERFAIFPVYEFDKLVYYQGRTYSKSNEGKNTKRFPRKVDVPLGAGNWLYNFNEASKAKIVIVVESILNVLSLRKILAERHVTEVAVVAVFKHAISRVQLSKMMALPALEFCLMFDSDATASSWKSAQKIYQAKRKASIATMPSGIDANDDAEVALKMFNAREEFDEVGMLLAG